MRKVPGVASCVQHHAVAAPGSTIPFLGVVILSSRDQDTFVAATATQGFADAIADVANFADEARLPAAFVEDVVIV